MQILTDWIEHYGYVILFLSLMLKLLLFQYLESS